MQHPTPTQIQLKVSLSTQLNDLLETRATRLGVPVTQFVKYLILREVEQDAHYPTFRASRRVEKNAAQALDQLDQAVDASVFFDSLHER